MYLNALDQMPQSEVLAPRAKVGSFVLSIVARGTRLMEVVILDSEVWIVVFVERNN